MIDLYRQYLPCRLAQILSHRTDARANFQHKIVLCHIRRLNDLFQYPWVNEKILSKFFLKMKIMFLQNLYGFLWIS